MAGPSEANEKVILDAMRTVDATPPFDTILSPNGGTVPEFRAAPILVVGGLAALAIFGIYQRRRRRATSSAEHT
jgi:hypothetical protein